MNKRMTIIIAAIILAALLATAANVGYPRVVSLPSHAVMKVECNGGNTTPVVVAGVWNTITIICPAP